MSAGPVTTARGRRLHMGELKLRQRKPSGATADMRDTVQRRERSAKPVNVRGHIPSLNGVINTSQSINVPKSIVVEETPEHSIADYTSVVIDNSDGRLDKSSVDVSDALDTIIGDLEQMRKRDNKGDAKGRRVK